MIAQGDLKVTVGDLREIGCSCIWCVEPSNVLGKDV